MAILKLPKFGRDKYVTARDYVERQLSEMNEHAQREFDETGDTAVNEIEYHVYQTLLRVKDRMDRDQVRENRIWTIMTWLGLIGILAFCLYHGLIG